MDDLVDTDWLADKLGEEGLVVLDASLHLPAAGRDARAEFAAGHIPAARFLDLASLRDPAAPAPNTLPSPAQFAARMRALGVGRDARVVLYDDSALKSSARAWFVLRMNGMREVAILDGGLAKWRAEGRPLERGEPPPPAPADFPLPAPDRARVRDKAAMLANLAGRAEQVLDARDAGRFTGDSADAVHGLRGGHIPGAGNLPYGALFADDGTWRPPAELRAAFERAGIDLARPLVASCGSGVTAAVLLFALHRLGKADCALYDGSWSEWGADPATPKETGVAA